jgi:hypothetical protein
VQVVHHFAASEDASFELLAVGLLLLCEVDADERQVQLVAALGQQPGHLVELVGKDDLVDPGEVDGPVLDGVGAILAAQSQKVIPGALLSTEHVVQRLEHVLSVSVIAIPVGGPVQDYFYSAEERFAVGEVLQQRYCPSWLFVGVAALAEVAAELGHRHPSVEGTACRLEAFSAPSQPEQVKKQRIQRNQGQRLGVQLRSRLGLRRHCLQEGLSLSGEQRLLDVGMVGEEEESVEG